jgi:hypothetical protein
MERGLADWRQMNVPTEIPDLGWVKIRINRDKHLGSATLVMNVGIQDERCGDGTSCSSAAFGKCLASG